jgi:2-polyprenyl-6-hydroxyphenyl methylase/3-demethylubiquinone-9 3-methyltransferase
MGAERYPRGHWARSASPESGLARYLRKNQSAYDRAKNGIFRMWLPDPLTGQKVLDFGGGGGILAVSCLLRGALVTLVDAAPGALEVARHHARRAGFEDSLELIHAGSLPAGLQRRRFELILLKDVIEHVEDDVGLLRQLASSQPPGGALLLSTQNRRSLNYLLEGGIERLRGNPDWCGWDTTHLRFYTHGDLEKLLNRSGYRITHWRSIYLLPYQLMIWPRRLARRGPLAQALHAVDTLLGSTAPLQRLGWNLIVRAERVRDRRSSRYVSGK